MVSPFRSSLYRTACLLVILGGAVLMTQHIGSAQSKPASMSKGPRALGLLELMPNGTARLIPVTILYEGKFYDAGSYKASPVPMALESQTVYEGVKAGISQGLFTISGALEGPNNTWIGAGSWLPAGSVPAKAAKKPEPTTPRGIDEDKGPPVLRRSPAKPAESQPASTAPAPSTATASPSAQATGGGAAPAPVAANPNATNANAANSGSENSGAVTLSPQADDADRPRLKRGKPEATEQKAPSQKPSSKASASASATSAATPARAAAAAKPSVQLIPAVSDAGGPDFHSYLYSMKTTEEAELRKKILALAATEVAKRSAELSGKPTAPTPAAGLPSKASKAGSKVAVPSFEDVQFNAFDLSSNNEPVLVLTAKAQAPPGNAKSADPGTAYMVTVVAREDIYGELHKALSNVTDAQHLDVLPRMEFIDAVDADGDGRGELLFRQVGDAGSAFSIYRVIGNQLYPLFQGVAGE